MIKSYCGDIDLDRRWMEVACLPVYFIRSVSVVLAVQIYVEESQILLTFSIPLSSEITEESQNRLMFFFNVRDLF